MPSHSWNDAEDALLALVSTDAQVVYLRLLRKHMDYRTGVVGITWRIGEHDIIHLLTIKPAHGNNTRAKPITRQYARSRIDELCRVGLIAPWPKPSYNTGLVFRLVMATSDRSVQNLNNRRATHRTTNGKRYNNVESQQVRDKNDVLSNRMKSPGTTIYPKSEISDPPLSPPQGGRERAMQANGAKNRRNRGSREQQARDCVLDKLKKANGRKDD